MATAVLLQAYAGASDAEAVELTVVDLRWQLLLKCLGADQPAFSQGTLHDFRARLIRTDMDRRLLERTVEFARAHGFDPKKLPKDHRIAMDSMPLEGAGRVSFNSSSSSEMAWFNSSKSKNLRLRKCAGIQRRTIKISALRRKSG